MSSAEPREASVLKDWILSEIRRLGLRQEALLRGAAFVGFTREEMDEYNDHASRIADLVKQLTLLYSNTDSRMVKKLERTEKA